MKSNDHFCILSCSNPCFCGYIHQNHVRETSQFWPIFVEYKGKSRKERTFQMLLSAGKYMNDTFWGLTSFTSKDKKIGTASYKVTIVVGAKYSSH